MRSLRSTGGSVAGASVLNGAWRMPRQALLARLAALCALALLAFPAAAEPMRIVVFGDSLSAGLGLTAPQSFPARLEAALKAKGYDVRIENAGVSGDTASAGLARLEWSVREGTAAVRTRAAGARAPPAERGASRSTRRT